MFEHVTAFEMAFVAEKVVDRGIGRGEFLEGANVPKPRHRFFPSAEWLARVLGPIVKLSAAFLAGRFTMIFIAARYDQSRSVTITFG